MEGRSHATWSSTADLLAIRTQIGKKKAAESLPAAFFEIMAPHTGHLRNFLLTFGGKLSELQVLFSSQ